MESPVTDERSVRLSRLAAIRQAGINPYQGRFHRSHALAEAVEQPMDTTVTVAGRIMSRRVMGKIAFCHLQDFSGRKQVVFKVGDITQEEFSFFADNLDIGDFIGVEGEVFTTQKGEISILVRKFELLSKALLPLPDKFHGLSDVDTRYRQRYLDLIANDEVKQTFIFRSNLIRTIRQFYYAENFLEVETPTLMHQATGATAEPYQTHNNALDIDLYLRISHELPLKELIIGGFEKIFELGKAFRNEGVDPSHLPEHTHLEHYCAYWDFNDNIAFIEKMFAHIFAELNLPLQMEIENRDGQKSTVDWQTPWPRVDFVELIKKDTGIDVMTYEDRYELLTEINRQGIVIEGMDNMSLVGLVDNLYKKVSRPKIINPTILYNYPKYLQPLARVNDENPNIVDQFQLVVNGWEIVKAYSELADPIDQAARFGDQNNAKQAGEEETMEGDDEYITAMEHGMPPTSGLGIGVDRLVSILSGHNNLRDVVLFPLLRPVDSTPTKSAPIKVVEQQSIFAWVKNLLNKVK